MSSTDLVARLRQRLITVPKPGTKPWKTSYPFTLTATVGGEHKAGDDAGIQQVGGGVYIYGSPSEPMLQEHVYAVEPLCEEAAQEIERLRNWRASK